MSSNYWSSTTNANNTNNAWHVNFNNGNINNNNKSNSYYVRAVRAGKCELFSFVSVYRAYLDCRKRKRGTINALRFEYDLLENLTQLALKIQQGTYRPSTSVCFITTRPKMREIFAADFRDRIVHHPHKSLFANEPDKGLPIGNLTSQFLSNIYLNELDQFVKHTLKCRFYIRYVDDFVLVSGSKEELLGWRDEIEVFLAERLSLRLKNSGALRRVSDGSDFLGYIVRPRYTLARRRVVNNLKAKLDQYRSSLVSQVNVNECPYSRFLMEPEMVMALRQTLSSYLGHFKHADAFNLLQALWNKHSWLSEYFILDDGILRDRFKYRGVFRSFRAQFHFFRSRLSDEVAGFVRVGKFYELFGADARSLGAALGLHPVETLRRMKCVAGFPARMRNHYVKKALATGFCIAVIEEKGHGQFVMDRYIHEIFRFGGYHA